MVHDAILGQTCPTRKACGWTFPTIARGNMSPVEKSPLRDTLAQNLRRMITHDLRPGERYSVRAWAQGKGLDVKMIDRLTKGQHAVTLDHLHKIAEACGLQAWHLLLEDFEPGSEPDAPISEADRALLLKLRRLLDL